MFKSLGDLIHRTSWLALIGGGVSILIGLVLFTAPIHLLRLSDTGRTPQEKSAIKREINLAFGDRALTIAESVVRSMRSRAADPDRIRDFDVALGEMARARGELARAEAEIAGAVGGTARQRAAEAREAATEANQAALKTATDAAQSALESAVDSREAIELTRDEAISRLRDRGVDVTATQKSFEELLKSARDTEKTARESLAAIKALPQRAAPKGGTNAATPPQPPVPAESPAPAGTDKAGGAADPAEKSPTLIIIPDESSKKRSKPISIHFGASDTKAAVSTLPPEVRRDIRAKVAGDVWRVGIGSALILLYIPLFLMVLTAKYLLGRSRRALAFAEEKKHEAKVSDSNRQITEARLQALQAQVEPHFLYNTLANVQALTEIDPPAANAMVGHLIQYLRAALPKMRESTSTVGQEVDLIRAYLNILKMRMGARLEFAIDVPPELLTRPFPPMMLPSLVENAIKHGLEPMREGGRIDVVASRVSVNGVERIRMEVRDTGRGLSDTPVQAGSGVGLTNLRERLHALHGDEARFTIGPNVPRGVTAAIEVPPLGVSGPPASGFVPGSAFGAAQSPGAAAAPATSAGGPPVRGWRRAWRATSKTHSVWASIVSKMFFGLMLALAVFFALSLIALYSGSMPIDLGNLRLEGIEGKAFGSLLLLAAFVVATIVAGVLAAVFYGLGFVFAGLLIIVPAIIVVSIFPFLAPFIVIGLLIWWLWRLRRKKRAAAAAAAAASGAGPAGITEATAAGSAAAGAAGPPPL